MTLCEKSLNFINKDTQINTIFSHKLWVLIFFLLFKNIFMTVLLVKENYMTRTGFDTGDWFY